MFLSRKDGLREALVKAALALFTFVAASTELLSLYGLVTLPMVAAVWIGMAVGVVVAVVWTADWMRIGWVFRSALLAVRREGFLAWCLGLAACVFMAGTLIVALSAPPNTWDAMTYHMARVAEWIQRAEVSFFPTSIGRQNYQMPLANFAVLHLQILSDSDRYANLVQWFSYLLCGVLSSLVVRDLGRPFAVQLLAAFVALTLPSAILQSNSTQNDLVCAVFCLSFAWFLLRYGVYGARADGLRAGLAMGLALLVKGTAYLFCGGVGLVLGLAVLIRRRGEWRTVVVTAVAAAALAAAVNMGHWSRTFSLYGTPISGGSEPYTTETISAKGVAANIVRNAAMHVGLPAREFNLAVTRGVAALLGPEILNPKTTWQNCRFAVVWSRHEDRAGDFLHLVLVTAGILLLLRLRGAPAVSIRLFAGAAVMAGLLFCVYLKWQPWHMRLHVPLFMLALPAAVAALAAGRLQARGVLLGLAALCFVAGLPFLFFNQSRPLLSRYGYSTLKADRGAQYFAGNPALREDYEGAMRFVLRSRAGDVGLMLGEDDWEYPLWVLAGKHAQRRLPDFRHVWVKDISRLLEFPGYPPELIITTLPVTRETIANHGYETGFESGNVRVLKRKPQPEP